MLTNTDINAGVSQRGKASGTSNTTPRFCRGFLIGVGALRIPDAIKSGRGLPLCLALSLRFVSCEDSNLRLVGSEPNLTEILSRY